MMSESTRMEKETEEIRAAENSETHNSEFAAPRWSVTTYESVAVSNLTYDEALDWVKKLDSQKISGLCIITDEAAARISENG